MLKLSAALLLVSYASAGNNVHVPRNKEIDCSDKENTFYTYGCNTKFTRCHDKKAYVNECPAGLYFDALRGHCDYKDDVKECQDAEHYETILLKTPTDFSCENRKDGLYAHPDIACDKMYYNCVYGRAIKSLCGHEQFFDEENQRCEFRHRVKACGGKGKKVSGTVAAYPEMVQSPSGVYGDPPKPAVSQPMDTAPPASPPAETTTTGKPYVQILPITKDDKTPDCKTLGNGVYRDLKEKCAAHFWKCSNEKIFKYRCPNDLFYDADRNRCDHKTLIPDCGGERPATTEKPVFDQPTVDFDCTGKEDNYYVKNPCETTFFHCNGGSARQLSCADGLVYDPRISACDYPLACSGERTTAAPPSNLGDHGGIQQAQPEEIKVNFDCSGKKDGMYALDVCVKDYVQCTSSRLSVMQCPANLVFNGNNCDYADNCNKAASEPEKVTETAPKYFPAYTTEKKAEDSTTTSVYQPTTDAPTTTTTTAETSTTTTAAYTYTKPAPAAAPATIDFSCDNLENGAHAVDVCSADYVECWNGAATPQSCSSGLMFNTYNGQCDYKLSVPGCNPGMEFVPPTTAAPAAAPAASVPVYSPPVSADVVATTTRQPAVVDPFCERLADGFYGSGCTNFFYSCNGGATYKMPCPASLFYDTDLQMCTRKESIVACGAKPTKKPAASNGYPKYNTYTTAEPAPVVVTRPARVRTTTTTPRPVLPARSPVDFDCSDKKDGLYALPDCTPTFIQCWNGKVVQNECQSGLFYNEVNGMCDYKEHVPACGGSVPSAATEEKKYGGEEIDEKIAEDAKKLDLNCVGKGDGYYADGCSNVYYSCLAGKIEKHLCPADLRFSAILSRCDYPTVVEECGAAPVDATATTTTTAAPAIPEGEGAQAPPSYDKQFSCAGKPDGFYEISACSTRYASCQLGRTMIGTCSASLVYHGATELCDYPANVPGCNINDNQVTPAPAPVTTPAPAASDLTCKGMRDGNYPIGGCSSEFFQCSHQMVLRARCPANLVMNPSMGYCDQPSRVSSCQSANAPAPRPYNAPVQGPAPVPAPAPATALSQQSIFTCQGKEDGIYGIACKTSFWRCSASTTYEVNCPTGLVFDISSGRCNYRAYAQC